MATTTGDGKDQQLNLFTMTTARRPELYAFISLIAPTNEKKAWTTVDAIGAYCTKCSERIRYSSGDTKQIVRHMEKNHPEMLKKRKEEAYVDSDGTASKKTRKGLIQIDVSDFERLNKGQLPRCPLKTVLTLIEMERYDELREQVIKQSRDINKCSKQAIFALHENAVDKATKNIQQSATNIQKVLPLITADQSLRYGAFSGALEEYVV